MRSLAEGGRGQVSEGEKTPEAESRKRVHQRSGLDSTIEAVRCRLPPIELKGWRRPKKSGGWACAAEPEAE